MALSPHRTDVSPWIARFAALVRVDGAVLDLACGGGRHSRVLLDRGCRVTAIDRDISQAARAEGAELIQADLEDCSPWPLPGRAFDAVVVTNYLWRPLFPHILAALAPDGILLYETFAAGHERFGRPSNPAHLLGRGELLALTRGLTVVAYEDGVVEDRKVVQRIAAVNGQGPLNLP